MTFLQRLREWWNSQKEVVVVTPLRIRDMEPQRFRLEGRILAVDPQKTGRTISKTGSSRSITVPEEWVTLLELPLTEFLIETDRKAIIIQPLNGDKKP